MMSRSDLTLRAAMAGAALRVPDGIGIILAALLSGHAHRGRVAGPTLTLKMCDQGRAYGLKHYFYGGRDGCAEEMAGRLKAKYPGLQIAGGTSPRLGDLTQEEGNEVVQKINACKPDIVWVGLGAPKQEKWMAAHLGRINCAAMIGIGAAFDFHAGRVRWAPEVIRKAGLEWAYRFAMEPRRMWQRDIQSVNFVALAALNSLRMRFVAQTDSSKGSIS